MPSFSIIIPAFDEEAALARSLPRLRHALERNRRPDFSCEVVVCDNNSTDRTAAVARENGARVVFEPVNQISRARNTGAQAACGEWLLFLDADSYPPAELLAETLDLIAAGGHVGCGATVSVEGGTLFNRLRMERLNPVFRLLKLSGGVYLACRREAFESIRGFSLALYAYEEIDLVLRLKRFARARGERFAVLHRHPVVTSGRKGEHHPVQIAVLVWSNFAAVVLFALHYLLPQRLTAALGSRLLGYWYGAARPAPGRDRSGRPTRSPPQE